MVKKWMFAAGFIVAMAAAVPASAQAARHYDCTKAGNANKAACKGTVAAAAPASRAPAAARNYDCSKAGNANKAACKSAATAAPATTRAPAPAAPRAAPQSAPKAAAIGQNTNPGGPNGATAQCRDNTYSHSAHRSGTCAGHGGVAKWY